MSWVGGVGVCRFLFAVCTVVFILEIKGSREKVGGRGGIGRGVGGFVFLFFYLIIFSKVMNGIVFILV